jgi:hypothetical protein
MKTLLNIQSASSWFFIGSADLVEHADANAAALPAAQRPVQLLNVLGIPSASHRLCPLLTTERYSN